jgi:hypothetical protein
MPLLAAGAHQGRGRSHSASGSRRVARGPAPRLAAALRGLGLFDCSCARRFCPQPAAAVQHQLQPILVRQRSRTHLSSQMCSLVCASARPRAGEQVLTRRLTRRVKKRADPYGPYSHCVQDNQSRSQSSTEFCPASVGRVLLCNDGQQHPPRRGARLYSAPV